MRTELYRFTEGSTVWTYTNSNKAVVYETETYTPVSISHGAIEDKESMTSATLQINLSILNTLARRWNNTTLEVQGTLTLYQVLGGVVSILWKGNLTAVKANLLDIGLVFESLYTSQAKNGLGVTVQRACPHILYGNGCFKNKNDVAVSGTASAIAGNVITVAAASGAPDGTYNGGILKSPDGIVRYIVKHQGSSLTVIRQFNSLNVSDSVTLYPGCDRSASMCNTTFNNLVNYGGFPYIPLVDPFSSAVA